MSFYLVAVVQQHATHKTQHTKLLAICLVDGLFIGDLRIFEHIQRPNVGWLVKMNSKRYEKNLRHCPRIRLMILGKAMKYFSQDTVDVLVEIRTGYVPDKVKKRRGLNWTRLTPWNREGYSRQPTVHYSAYNSPAQASTPSFLNSTGSQLTYITYTPAALYSPETLSSLWYSFLLEAE
jgi:hypothetical protein